MKQKISWKDIRKTIIFITPIIFVSIASGHLASWALGKYRESKRIEAEIANLHTAPLIGLILRDNPSAVKALKEAITKDIDSKTTERSRIKASELTKTLAWPSIAVAQDEKVVAIWKAQHALLAHLEKANIRFCREFFDDGLRDANALDPTSRALFDTVLKSLENGYSDGKKQPQKPTTLNETDWIDLFSSIGFTESEMKTLADTSRGNDRDVCDVGLKLHDGMLTKIRVQEQPRLMRAIFALISSS